MGLVSTADSSSYPSSWIPDDPDGCLGLTISDGQIVVRGGAKTHRIPFAEVKTVEVNNKDLLGNGLVSITTTTGRTATINGIIGRRAYQLAAALKDLISEHDAPNPYNSPT